MIEFGIEDWDTFWKDGEELARESYLETGEGLPFSPDVPAYRELYGSGSMVILTVRDSGAMVGYLIMIIRQHLHCQSVKSGLEDGLYLKPASRVGTTGIRMIKMMNVILKGLGVSHVFYTSRPQVPLDRLYCRLGMSHVASMFMMELK